MSRKKKAVTIGAMENVPQGYRGIDWDGLTHARRALIGNAFTTPPDDLHRGTTWFAENGTDVPSAMLGLCEMDKRQDARKLVIAAAHAYARLGRLDGRLKPLCEGVDAAKEKGLRLEPEGLTRLAHALERFATAAKRLLGTSDKIRAVREEVWTLCFGPNLFESLDQERTLRQLRE